MKRTRRFRASLTFLAAALFLAFILRSTPSDTAPPDPYLRPADTAETQDSRASCRGAGAADGRFHAFRPGDLDRPADSPRPLRSRAAVPARCRRRVRRRGAVSCTGMPYGTAIALAAERHQVDGLLLAAIVAVESDFPPAPSPPRARCGLMQVIPELAADYGVKGDLLDPYVNVEVGSRYVSGLIKDYKGDLERTLAAYNAGPGAVDRYKGSSSLRRDPRLRPRGARPVRGVQPQGWTGARQASRGCRWRRPIAPARAVAYAPKTKSRLKPAQVWRAPVERTR